MIRLSYFPCFLFLKLPGGTVVCNHSYKANSAQQRGRGWGKPRSGPRSEPYKLTHVGCDRIE